MAAEGLVYHEPSSSLFWTDGNCVTDPPHDSVLRWSDGEAAVVRSPSGHGNGQLLIGDVLLTGETTGRQISWSSVSKPKVTSTLVAYDAEGVRLNSPNDLAFRSADTSLWFTDPAYGCYQFNFDCENAMHNSVYRMDLADDGTSLGRRSRVSRMPDVFVRPNGLAFSPDEKVLYVVDSGAILSTPATISDARPHNVTAFTVEGEALTNPRLFAVVESPANPVGIPDGIKVDEAGRVYVAAGDGVQVFEPQEDGTGKLIRSFSNGGVQCSNLVLADRLYVGCGPRLFELDVPEAKPSAKAPLCAEAHDGFWVAACASALAPGQRSESLELATSPHAMDVLSDPISGLLQTLLLFLVGLGLRTFEVLDQAQAAALCKFVVKVSMPALLLTTFVKLHIEAFSSLLIVLVSVLGYALIFGLLPATFIFAGTPNDLNGILISMSMGWNIGLFAFPIVKLLYGDEDFEYIALFDIPNVMVNFGLSYAVVSSCAPKTKGGRAAQALNMPPLGYIQLDGNESKEDRQTLMQRVSVLTAEQRQVMYQKIASFPPLAACLGGMALKLAGLKPEMVPAPVMTSLQQVGGTTTPLSLIAMGLLTNLGALRLDRMRMLSKLLMLRFGPSTIFAFLAVAIDDKFVHGSGARTILLGLVMPVPFVAIPYASDFGYDATFAASAVVCSTLISFVLVALHVLLMASL
jgi:gluconolactonase